MFAWKLIRPFGTISLRVIKSEIRVVEHLCKPGSHKNIVAVLHHGRLPQTYYFIDMELCDLSLNHYIYWQWTPAMREVVPYFTTEFPSRLRMSQMWDVMEDVMRGVAFVHTHKHVHCDIKPHNSIFT